MKDPKKLAKVAFILAMAGPDFLGSLDEPMQGPPRRVSCCESPLWVSTGDCENCGRKVRCYDEPV